MKDRPKYDLSKGKLLISKPLVNDDFFHNSVVLLTEYNTKGVVGFIVNKPIHLSLQDIINEFPEFNTQIYFGGPVASDNLYFIHRIPEKIEGSIHIKDDLYWGGNFNQVVKLIKNQELDVEDIRFFLGYSGWNLNQLDEELDSNSWIIDQLEESLFDWDVMKLWENRLNGKGDEYKIWANAPKEIGLN